MAPWTDYRTQLITTPTRQLFNKENEINTLEEQVEVCQAIVDDKEIQYMQDDQWGDTNTTRPNFSMYTFRVKPVPKPDIVKVVRITLFADLPAIAGIFNPNIALTFSGDDPTKLISTEVL